MQNGFKNIKLNVKQKQFTYHHKDANKIAWCNLGRYKISTNTKIQFVLI